MNDYHPRPFRGSAVILRVLNVRSWHFLTQLGCCVCIAARMTTLPNSTCRSVLSRKYRPIQSDLRAGIIQSGFHGSPLSRGDGYAWCHYERSEILRCFRQLRRYRAFYSVRHEAHGQGRPQADTVANASNASPIYLGKALALFSKADGLAGEPIGVDSLLPGRRKRSICGQGLKKVRRDGRLGIRRLEEWQTWQ